MKKYVIIVAGGSGSRMQSNTPKQFLLLGNKPVLMHTISAFRKYDQNIKILLVLPENQIHTWDSLCETFHFQNVDKVVAGGSNRFYSVKNGLNEIKETCIIGIHDGVRPFVSSETITNCYTEAEKFGAVVPVLPVQESLRIEEKDVNYAINRSLVKIVQTPQVFMSDVIMNAYSKEFDAEAFTDDASVVEKNGGKIQLVEGNRENIKITTPFDLIIGEALVKS